MPHKRNPARAVLAVAAGHRVPGLAATLLAGMPAELQRATGRWQAEPGTLTDLLRLVGAVAHHTRAALDGIGVDVGRMRSAVDALPGRAGGRLEPATIAGTTAAAAAVVDAALAAYARHERLRAGEAAPPGRGRQEGGA